MDDLERVTRASKTEPMAQAGPLSPTQLAVGELVEMLAAGREPREIRALGWEHAADRQEQRRRAILEAEISAAPPLGVPD